MADEADILELSGANPINFNCADDLALSKGMLLVLSGDYIVKASSAQSEVYAGVAAADKQLSDGATTIAVHVPGSMNVFDMKCGTGTVPLGSIVQLSGANLIGIAAAAQLLTGAVVGKALEAGAASEVIRVLS